MSEQKDWVVVQTKTFTKWVNTHLKNKGVQIGSVIGDLTDGVNLIYLLESIAGEPIGANTKPRMKIHKIENVNRALDFIKNHDVDLPNTGSEEIVDMNEKMTLGLIWILILRFVIAGLSEDGMSAKQGLLLWCQKKTEPYKPRVHIEDFQRSWTDGLGFCALIHRHRPDIISMDDRDSSDPVRNLTDAFEVAERELGISKLLDIEDIVGVERPDEKSIMTYVAQYYAYFSSLDKYDTAGRHISNFLLFQKEIGAMQHDYEERTRKLHNAANSKIEEFSETKVHDTYRETLDSINQFRNYRKTQRREFIRERDALSSLFSSINLKLRSQGLTAYVAPHGLSVQDTADVLENLSQTESKRRSELNNLLREIQERVQKSFANLANSFNSTVLELKNSLTHFSGDLEEQLHATENNYNHVNNLENQLPAIKAAEVLQEQSSVEVNIYTDHTYDDLSFEFEQLKLNYNKTIDDIRAQIMARQQSTIPAEKYEEFREAFFTFDVDKDSLLSRLELKSALSALGVIDIDFDGSNKDFEAIFKSLEEGGAVKFDAFANFMSERVAEKMDANHLNESFNVISNGKPYVTVDDLRRSGINQDTIDFIVANVPQTPEGGYDYRDYLGRTFM